LARRKTKIVYKYINLFINIYIVIKLRVISFVNETELEEKVDKSNWTKELKGAHEYKFENSKVQLPADFPDKNFELSLSSDPKK